MAGADFSVVNDGAVIVAVVFLGSNDDAAQLHLQRIKTAVSMLMCAFMTEILEKSVDGLMTAAPVLPKIIYSLLPL